MIVGYDADSAKSGQGVGTYASNLLDGLRIVDDRLVLEPFNYMNFYNNMSLGAKLSKFWLRTTRRTSGDAYWEWNVLPGLGEEKKIEIFHAMGGCVPKKAKFKTVMTIHDLAFYYYPDYLPKKTARFFKTWYRESAESADAVIAISECTKKDILKFWNVQEEKIHVVHHGVSGDFRVKLDTNTISACLSKYKIKTRYFLFVGELNHRKNIHTLIDAFSIVSKEVRDVKLVLAGKPQEGSYPNQIQEKIDKLGLKKDVIFTGRVSFDELKALYQEAIAFVFPTQYEGFGLPVLEAMASGAPVISSKNSSIPEIAGDAAILVNHEKSEDLANAMSLLARNENERTMLKRKGIEQVSKFTWEMTAKKTLKLYSRLIEG